MHAEKNPGCHADYNYCCSLIKKERRKKERKKEERKKETYILLYIRACKTGKLELKNTKPVDSNSCLCPVFCTSTADGT